MVKGAAVSEDASLADETWRASFAQTLKSLRAQQGLSLSELARKAGVAKSSLSKLEAGEGNPSLETLWVLSSALGIGVRDLIDPTGAEAAEVARYTARADEADYAVTLVSPSPKGASRDIYRVAFQPGEAKVSDGHPQGTFEHVVLLTGSAKVGPLDDVRTLAPGDYTCFPAHERHIYEALSPNTTAILIMESLSRQK